MRQPTIDIFRLASGRFKAKAWGRHDNDDSGSSNFRIITVPGQPQRGHDTPLAARNQADETFPTLVDLAVWASKAGNGSHLGDDNRHGAIVRDIEHDDDPSALGRASATHQRNHKAFLRAIEQLEGLERMIHRRLVVSKKVAGCEEERDTAAYTLSKISLARIRLQTWKNKTERQAQNGTKV